MSAKSGTSRTIVVERISYTVFAIRGGKLLKTWARIGNQLKPITATTELGLRKKLRKVSVDLLNGQTDAAGLESRDHRAYIAAVDELKDFPGLTVDGAVREYSAVRRILGPISLIEAVRFYQQHGGHVVSRRTIREVMEEFLRQLVKRSDSYREIFSYDLERLARAVGAKPIGEVTPAELEAFVAATGRTLGDKWIPASDWRREQVRTQLVTFFNYARKKNYLPRKLDHAAHALAPEETISEAREVWDPEHLRRALEIVTAHERPWLPWLALSSFANVRSLGARRLTWPDVHFLDNLVELKARNSKIKKRVTVGLTPTLLSWIDPFRGQRGSICPEKGFGAFTARLRKKYELPYYKNVLRRSYITYLLAETDDEDHVARVANTSVAKLRENYRQIRTFAGRLVTKDLAAAWFGTSRISADNVVQLEFGQVTTK